jgi:hypothetical protein
VQIDVSIHRVSYSIARPYVFIVKMDRGILNLTFDDMLFL